MIKAVFFDMDGVLIDARDWHFEALNKALGLFGLSISRYDHLHTFDGLPTKVKLEMLSEQYYLPKQLHGLINELKQKYTTEMIYAKCRPVFCHEYALSRLSREGYRIAVCSNSVKKTIENMMRMSALYDYINLIISNEDVSKPKPDPEIYIKAAENFGLLPEECMVVEDNKNGIAAGIASGAHVMRVSGVQDVNYGNIIRNIRKAEQNNND